MALATFYSFAEFANKGKEPVCQKWNGEFRSEYYNRNKCTTSRGDPEYSGGKKPKRTFPFEFRLKFPESFWHNGKHPCMFAAQRLQIPQKLQVRGKSCPRDGFCIC